MTEARACMWRCGLESLRAYRKICELGLGLGLGLASEHTGRYAS